MLGVNDVYNMDCLKGLALVDSESVDLVVTDPPYEVNYDKKSEELSKLGKARDKQVERDASFVDVIIDYDLVSRELFRVLKNNSHAYLFCGDKQIVKWSLSMQGAGFKAPQVLVWKKNKTTFDMTMGFKFPENKEFILFFHKGWKKLNGWSVERHDFRSVLCYNSSSDTEYHSCAKPKNLLMFLVKASSKEGDLCLDIFCGSGNHLIVFRRLRRRFLGFELSEVYFRTIKERLVQEMEQKLLTEV